jgi:hypothetical protein
MKSYRFVDRDILMRYHWGLGVGHPYAHTPPSNQGGKNGNDADASGDEDDGTDAEEQPPHTTAEHRDVDRSSEEPDTPNRSDSDEGDRDSSDSEGGGHSTDDDQDFEPTTSYD